MIYDDGPMCLVLDVVELLFSLFSIMHRVWRRLLRLQRPLNWFLRSLILSLQRFNTLDGPFVLLRFLKVKFS